MVIIILIALVGIALIFLEFFLPGAVLATIGSIALLVSLGMFFAKYSAFFGVLYLILLIVAVLAACKLALWRLKNSGKKGEFYHSQDQEGYLASSFDQNLIGKEGVVATELKPAGHILVEGKIYQALSETGFISSGIPIRIVGGKGSHFIVRTIG